MMKIKQLFLVATLCVATASAVPVPTSYWVLPINLPIAGKTLEDFKHHFFYEFFLAGLEHDFNKYVLYKNESFLKETLTIILGVNAKVVTKEGLEALAHYLVVKGNFYWQVGYELRKQLDRQGAFLYVVHWDYVYAMRDQKVQILSKIDEYNKSQAGNLSLVATSLKKFLDQEMQK